MGRVGAFTTSEALGLALEEWEFDKGKYSDQTINGQRLTVSCRLSCGTTLFDGFSHGRHNCNDSGLAKVYLWHKYKWNQSWSTSALKCAAL